MREIKKKVKGRSKNKNAQESRKWHLQRNIRRQVREVSEEEIAHIDRALLLCSSRTQFLKKWTEKRGSGVGNMM